MNKELFKSTCASRGRSLDDIASELDMSLQTLNDKMDNDDFNVTEAIKLADSLDMSDRLANRIFFG